MILYVCTVTGRIVTFLFPHHTIHPLTCGTRMDGGERTNVLRASFQLPTTVSSSSLLSKPPQIVIPSSLTIFKCLKKLKLLKHQQISFKLYCVIVFLSLDFHTFITYSVMIRALQGKCAQEGFDLCDPIHTQWYNDLIEDEGHVDKGTLKKISAPPTICERTHGDAEMIQYNACLIGNSKFLWPKFISWLSSQYENKSMNKDHGESSNNDAMNQLLNENPFDTFVTSTLSEIFRSFFSDRIEGGDEIASKLASYEFYWSNGVHYNVALNGSSATDNSERNQTGDYHCFAGDKPSSFLLSMQRAAKVTGNFWHDDEGTKLCVHPKFGTWTAFRAVVVFHKIQEPSDIENVIPEPPSLCLCPVAAGEIQKAKEIMEYALKISGGSSGYSDSSDSLCKYLHNSVSSGSDWSKVSPTMRPWIQLRDSISVGRDDYKYCDDQILYHYTKDIHILRRELLKNCDAS